MTDYLLDTNHATHVLAGSSPIADRVRSLREQGDRFGISMTVLGELHFAVYASRKRDQNAEVLEALLDSVLLWEFDRPAAAEFGHIQAEQKSRGRPIPPTDAQIAAVARLHGLTVLTADAHFGQVDGLAVENWLS